MLSLIYLDDRRRGDREIAQLVYRVDRSYSWNYSNGPTLPRRPGKLPPGPGARLLGHDVNSPLGISAGPLMNSKWIAAYARLGFDVLTYNTVRTVAQPAYALPNLAFVRNLPEVAVTAPAARGSDAW